MGSLLVALIIALLLVSSPLAWLLWTTNRQETSTVVNVSEPNKRGRVTVLMQDGCSFSAPSAHASVFKKCMESKAQTLYCIYNRRPKIAGLRQGGLA